MKFVFFGTPEVASRTLEYLIKNNWVPNLVVTNPDRPSGRGQQLVASPTKIFASENNIPVLDPEKLDDEAYEALKEVNADLAIVVAYGKIIPERFINLFPKGVINVHYSLLPKYRGATPLETALQNNDTETGVSLQKMVFELDAGDIIAYEVVPIKQEDTALSLRPRLIELGAKLLVDKLPAYLADEIELQPQDSSQVTYAPKRTKADGELNLDLPGPQNWSKFRAFNDTIGTYFFKDSKRYKVTAARLDGEQFIVERVIPEGRPEMEYKA